jgi:hypothetical protein
VCSTGYVLALYRHDLHQNRRSNLELQQTHDNDYRANLILQHMLLVVGHFET